MHTAHEIERRVLGPAEAYRLDILGHADHGGRHAVEGQSLAEGIFLRPESASETSRNHEGGAIGLLKLAASKNGYAEGLEEAGGAIVDIDGLDCVGARRRAQFHGSAGGDRPLV